MEPPARKKSTLPPPDDVCEACYWSRRYGSAQNTNRRLRLELIKTKAELAKALKGRKGGRPPAAIKDPEDAPTPPPSRNEEDVEDLVEIFQKHGVTS